MYVVRDLTYIGLDVFLTNIIQHVVQNLKVKLIVAVDSSNKIVTFIF